MTAPNLEARLEEYRAYNPNTDRDDHPICIEAATELRNRAERIAEQDKLLEAMAGALGKTATRFEHCSDMIAESFSASGTLRAERAIKAKHYALEARTALTQYQAYKEGNDG